MEGFSSEDVNVFIVPRIFGIHTTSSLGLLAFASYILGTERWPCVRFREAVDEVAEEMWTGSV